MKKLTGLVLVLAVLVLGGYYGMGVLTEQTIKKNIQVINQSNGLFAEITQYNRGWFNSNAQIKWSLHVPERTVKDANGQSQIVAAQDYQMEMPIVINHGPVIYTNQKIHFGYGYASSILPVPAKYNVQFDSLFTKESTKPQLDLSIFINYLNQSRVNLEIPTFKLFPKDGKGQIEWKGMKSTTLITSNVDKINGGFVIDGMNFNKDDAKVTLGETTTQYDLHKTIGGLFLGNANFSLPSFVVVAKDNKILEISKFLISSASEIEKQLFNTNFKASLNSIIVNGQTYGPGDIEISLRNLDADVLAQINEQATAIQNGSDMERQQALMALLPQLPKLLSKGPEFEISKLTMKLPQGMVEGHVLVSLPKGDNSAPLEIIQKIKGNATLKAPTAVVKLLIQQTLLQQMEKQPDMQQALIQQLQTTQSNEPPLTREQIATMQTDKQLAAWEQSGLITVDGTDYAIEITLEQGKFSVNNKPFDSSMMKF